MPKRIFSLIVGAALALGAHAALAQTKPPAGKAPAVQDGKPAAAQKSEGLENAHAICIGCHGIPGYKTAFPEVYHVPKIAGQQPAYIVNALKAYKAGERSHPSMRGVAASLSDKDMADLAAYYGAPAK
jgi:cytochrome c553